jgi:hypothetical protein
MFIASERTAASSNTVLSCLHLAFPLVAAQLPNRCSDPTTSQRKRRFRHQLKVLSSLSETSAVTQRYVWILRVLEERDDNGSQGALYRKCVLSARRSPFGQERMRCASRDFRYTEAGHLGRIAGACAAYFRAGQLFGPGRRRRLHRL